ncbi:MAG: glycoside hydrolase [Lachnospiraceae bacterium]|nr:glycoside hydrolase [Lachnospiraceae bacterium]
MKKQRDPIKRKNVRKVVRSIFQEIILITLLILIIRAIFTFETYEPYDATKIEMADDEEDTGFIALSYFGVDRNETKTLISTERLQEHIDALSKSGYVTITQQDILDYYQEGKKLPKKSLFLMFEDGRRDTAIFAQNVTEEYNYISTIMTYANKFETQDSKFLMPDDLKDLEEGTFCELGTNGYRLEYINAYDRYEHYLGQLNTLEYAHVQPYLDRNYNHYLMDYIRDEYGISRESYEQMKMRIDYDYDEMERIYTTELGYLPQMYVLMHSNTGQFGENDRVSAVNQARIFDMFLMNFNREGYTLNTKESSIYDLTRLQPQAYWHTNHLLMRIWDDTKQEVAWVEGDLERKANWEELNGKAEFQDNAIFLTCEPEKVGTLRLKESKDYQDVIVNTQLTGNKLGVQSIYLRADENLETYLCVKIENNELIVLESIGTEKDGEKELFRENLDEITQVEEVSIEEDNKAALIAAKELEVQYASNVESGKDAAVELSNLNDMKAATVEEGAEKYVAPINLNDEGNSSLHINLKEDKLTVTIDEYVAVEDLEVGLVETGYVYIQSGWGGEAYSQRNLSDDVYDGVFEDFEVTENTGAEEEVVLYDNKMHGFDKFCWQVENGWEGLLNWFIETF